MHSISGPISPRASMVLTALAIVLAIVGIGGIASGVADKPDDNSVASTGTTTTLGGDGGDTGGSDVTSDTTPTSIGGGGTATTAKAGSTATTSKPTATTVAASCTNAPAASADPGPHQPPAVGTFTYASCTDSETSETKIAAGPSGNGVTRRTISNDESGFDQSATLAWGPSGVLLESLTVKSPQGDFSCDWNPDVVNYPPAMNVGTTWNTKSSCDLKGANGASPGKLTLDASGKVTGKASYTVSGVTVNVWLIEGTIKLTTASPFGTTTATITQKSYYDPAHGLDVFRHSESNSPETGKIVRDERLVSFTPKS